MPSRKLDFSRPLGEQTVLRDTIKDYPEALRRVMDDFTNDYTTGDFNGAFRSMIRLFVSVFKYTGLIIVCDYLRISGGLDEQEQFKEILHIDKFLNTSLRGMSLGHWQWCLREITRWARMSGKNLFVSELTDLYWKNSGKPTKTAQWIDSRMIPLRNDYVHSDIRLEKENADRLIREHFPLLLEYLQEIRFISRYELRRTTEGVFSLTDRSGRELELHHLIIRSKEPEWPDEEVLFFETLKGKTVKYLLGNRYLFEKRFRETIQALQIPLKQRIRLQEKEENGENAAAHVLNETEALLERAFEEIRTARRDLRAAPEPDESYSNIFESLDKCLLSADSSLSVAKGRLAAAQEEIRSRKNEEWEHYRNAAKLLLYQDMITDQNSQLSQQQFDSLYIERDEAYRQYGKFIRSEGPVLSLLLAESGAGKTAFCTKRVREWLQCVRQESRNCEDIVFFFPSGVFPADRLEEFVMQRMGNPGQSFARALQAINDSDRPQEAKLVFIIDGLNEADDPAALLSFISDIMMEKPYPWLKIYLSCRIIMWDQLSRNLASDPELIYTPEDKVETASDVPFIRLGSFSPVDVEKAYEKYAVNRFIKTRFARLPHFVKELCSDPFLLNLITEAYRGQVRDRKEISFTSLDEIFTRYLFESKPKKLTTRKDNEPVPADLKIVRRLLEIMWREKKDFVGEEQLQADRDLEEMVYEPAPLQTEDGRIRCKDRICRWQWQPVPGEDIPFACPVCGNHTLDWDPSEKETIVCSADECNWRWTLDSGRDPSFHCPSGHALQWSQADMRTPYQRLLDEGVLTEIVRNDGAFVVKFRYDRIFEYLTAREILREPDYQKVLMWCGEIQDRKGISPIFLEAVATSVSLGNEAPDLLKKLIALQKPTVLYVASSAMKKLAVSSEDGQRFVRSRLVNLVRRGDSTTLNQVAVPVAYALKRQAIPVLTALAAHKNKNIRHEFSNLLYRIVSSNIDDGLYMIHHFLSSINLANILGKMELFKMLLDLSLKLASLLTPSHAVDLVNIWAVLIKRLTLSGSRSLTLKILRSISEGLITATGSTVVLSQMKKMIVGKTTLYNVLFTPSEFKAGMAEISEFFLPQPERLYLIEPTLKWFLNVPVDKDGSEGLEMLGLMPILIFNVQLRYDAKSVLPILENLYETGNLYARWAICSAVNYSLQESYFSHTGRKPLEQDDEVVQVFKGFISRFISEERDGIVRESLTEGDYYFPLGILVEFSYAVEKDSAMINDLLEKIYAENDIQMFRRLLLDMMCFSLDTFCVQRRFWEKTMDLLPKIIKRVFPLQKDSALPFPGIRESLPETFAEALAVFQYAYPNETDKMLRTLCEEYKTSDNAESYNFVTGLNAISREALNRPFRALRSNSLGQDKKGRPQEIESINAFIERFLYGWVFADFVSAIFGRYPAFRDVAKYWIQEPLAEQYEKNPRKLTKYFFRTIFDFLKTYEPVLPELD